MKSTCLMAAKTKGKGTAVYKKADIPLFRSKYIVTATFLSIIIALYSYRLFTKYGNLRKKKSEQILPWLEYIFPSGDGAKNDWSGVLSDVFTLVLEDLYSLHEYIIDAVFSAFQNLFLASVLVVLFVLTSYYVLKRYRHYRDQQQNGKKKGKKKVAENEVEVQGEVSDTSFHDRLTKISLRWWIVVFVVSTFLMSLPWEFVRLYQLEVAKRAAAMQGGAPAECIPENMGILESLKYWLQWHFSWRDDPCERYHRKLLVDPLSEVPPMMVLSSAVTRCILYPTELFFSGMGRCFRAFFSEIPTPWQPILMIFLIVILILLLVMSCRYRISFPLVFKFEPKTPVLDCRQKKCIESNESTREVCQLEYKS